MVLGTGVVINQRYRIVKQLAQGGFGTVYRAWDVRLKIPVALKQSLVVTADAASQFAREAEILAGMRHPNLPRVSDYFALDQGLFLVMDFVEGEDLQHRLEQSGKIAEKPLLMWIDQVADALSYLHTHKPPIIHRDLKPANIRITPQNQAILVDFGIAKTFDPGSKTMMGARAVTPPFSPIEQYGRGLTDPRTDIYALGVTLYLLLTGQEPPQSIDRQAGSALIPPGQLTAVTPMVEAAVLQAMQLMPSDRFQSVDELRRALKKAGGRRTGSPTAAAKPVSVPKKTKPAPTVPAAVPPQTSFPGETPPSPVGKAPKMGGGGLPPSALDLPHRKPAPVIPLRKMAAMLAPVRTLVVAPSGANYRTIQSAVDSAPDGARIVVRAGTYRESIKLERPVQIVGEGLPESVIIESTDSDCFYINSDQVSLQGLVLRYHAGPREVKRFGIEITRGETLIEGCSIWTDWQTCAAIYGKNAFPIFRRCKFVQGKTSAISLYKQARAVIEDCEFHSALVGIEITQQAAPFIQGCRFQDCHYGIYISAAQATVQNCDFNGSMSDGIQVVEGSNLLAKGCRISGAVGLGVFINDRSQGLLEDCSIISCGMDGIQVAAGSFAGLQHCRVNRNTRYGVFLRGKSAVEAQSCDLMANLNRAWKSDPVSVWTATGIRE